MSPLGYWFVRDGDVVSWWFKTGIQIYPEEMFGAVLYKLIKGNIFGSSLVKTVWNHPLSVLDIRR